jgi:hypothetical protein
MAIEVRVKTTIVSHPNQRNRIVVLMMTAYNQSMHPSIVQLLQMLSSICYNPHGR